MVDRKVVPFDEFYYLLKLMHLFEKHPVYYRNCKKTTFLYFCIVETIFYEENGVYQRQ
jgi:hypothetical protein